MEKAMNADHKMNNLSLLKKSKLRVRSLFLLFVVLLIFPVTASAARERYVLDFNDLHLRGHRGHSATLYLKKSLKAQYPWVRVSDLSLKKVILVAKSKRGRGGAELRVGNWTTDMYGVGGNPWSFHDQDKRSYDRVRLRNPSESSRGPWQINLRGNFKIRKVVLVVNEHKRRNYYGHFHRHW